jgi:hypothetical protein
MWLRCMGAFVLAFALQASEAFQPDTTQATLRAKYGPPTSESYLVRPGVIASVSYGPSGSLCKVVISPQQLWNRTLDYKQLTEIIDEIAPVNQRGTRRTGSFVNAICLPTNDCGGAADNWDNLSIFRNGSNDAQRYASLRWHRLECPQ